MSEEIEDNKYNKLLAENIDHMAELISLHEQLAEHDRTIKKLQKENESLKSWRELSSTDDEILKQDVF